ncbi:hypothetical protein EGW08_009170, partial [Elysia chlorotica]
MPVDDTVADLRRLKAHRSRERELRDLEERKLLDELHDANRRLRGSPLGARARDKRKRFQLSKDETVREMQIQYERHREMNMAGGGRRDYRRKPELLPRYNPSNDPKVKQLAESHGRNMESFHTKNRDLERQREEIRRRLEGLGRRPIKEDDSMNALFQELKDQEARNQRMLEELRRILASQNIPMPQMPQQEPKTSRYVYPIYYGNSLVAEIIAVRQAYIQNGGNDPDILQQLAQMQAEAQAIDDSLRNRPAIKIKAGKAQPDNSNLFALELENERLQRQLLLLQEQNIQARHRRKDDREDELERDIRRMHQDHLRKMYELQREIERLRHDTVYLRMREQQPSKIIVQQPPPIQAPPPIITPAPVQTKYIEVDRLAPYDYSAGFVIFYDFVLNLDPRIGAVRLIVGLHNNQAKLGEPTILPLVYTEPGARQATAYNAPAVNAVIGAR